MKRILLEMTGNGRGCSEYDIHRTYGQEASQLSLAFVHTHEPNDTPASVYGDNQLFGRDF